MMRQLLFSIMVVMCCQTGLHATDISASKSEGCVPFNATFGYNGDAEVVSYLWEFGNGTTSSVPNPTILFDKSGNYEVKLTITTAENTTETIQMPGFVRAEARPSVDFQVSSPEYCIGEEVSFTNFSTGATSFLWDFGDGATSTEENPKHAYSSSGLYSVILIAFSDLECSAVTIKNQIVTINAVNDLSIIVNDAIKCIDESTVEFSTQQPYVSYYWDFGDGNSSTAATPQHTYNSSGSYDVTVTVSDSKGCSATKQIENMVVVYDLPDPVLTISESIVCLGESVQFSGSFDHGEEVLWTFSDGYSTNERTFERSFEQPGLYDVALQVTNAGNCTSTTSQTASIEVTQVENPIVEFDTREGCTPFTATLSNSTQGVTLYEWRVDNTTVTGQNASYTFTEPGTYSVKAIMHHESGCTNELVFDSVFTVHDPIIEVIPSTYATCRTGSIEFELSDTNVSDISWDFGGYQTSTALAPQITWDTPGTFPVSVSFTNGYGCAQIVTLDKPITVHPDTISFALPDPILTCQSADVFFNGGLGNGSWSWDFGDGQSSNEQNPSHVYEAPGTYIVSLVTNNAFGCRTEINNYNEITVSEIESSFSAAVLDTVGGCPNFKLQLQSTTSAATKYSWTMDNGQTSTAPNPVLNLSTNGPTGVSLTVWNDEGCLSKAVQFVGSPWATCDTDSLPPMDGGALPPEAISGVGDTIILCNAPAQLNFNNPQINAIDWVWLFGDGHEANEANPSHTYELPGNYTVDLITYYLDGSLDTLRGYKKVIIEKPNANFSFEQEYVCKGTQTNFISPPGDIVSWEWNFGNGQTSSDENPSFTYTSPGIYQVHLSVTNSNGCQSKVIKNISVGNPYLQFTYDSNLCKDESLSITHNLEGFSSFVWEFGDGTTSTSTYPVHSYNSPGEYLLKVTASAGGLCSQAFYLNEAVVVNHPEADFTVVDNKVGCNQLDVAFSNTSTGAERYFWNFGNGQTSQAIAPALSYSTGSYDVSLVASRNGCADTLAVKDLVRVDSIYAEFSFEQDQTCLPVTVQFNDESMGATSWSWDFGNGETSSEKDADFIFNEYVENVTLTVSNENGCKASKTTPLDPILSVDFQPAKTGACESEPVQFNNLSKNAVEWLWDFGDGTYSTEQTPVHAYESAGKYSVSLVARSADGCEVNMEKSQVMVVKSVQAAFDVEIDDISCAPLLVRFNNLSERATKYDWLFGDGSASKTVSPIHVYTDAGSYDVRLIAKNDIGCSDTLLLPELINATGPRSSIHVSDPKVCHPQSIQFEDNSTLATKWEWIFGDGNTSSLRNPVHNYAQPGTYTVSLLSADIDGCEQLVKYDSIQVIATPEANFDLSDLTSCMPVTANVSNTSTNLQNAKFNWQFGDGSSSSQFEPEIHYSTPGTYRLTLQVTNENYCSDEHTFEEEIVVYDTTQLTQPKIHFLSVEDNEQIKLKSTPYSSNNFKYHVIYRKASDEHDYSPTDTLTSANEPYYADPNVIPGENAYSYKIQSHVYCNNPATLDDLTVYQSIHLGAEAADSSISVSWTAYHGHQFDHYSIFRRQQNGEWQEIGQTHASATGFVDEEHLCPETYEYHVKAVNLDGRSYYSSSNSISIRPKVNLFENQQVAVIRSTVENNSGIFTEWREPQVGADKVTYYQIWRSENEAPFYQLDLVPKGVTSYFDYDVDVQNDQYNYKIEVMNTCNVKGRHSNQGSSILMTKETQEYINEINWTPYLGWKDGVLHYLLQKQNEFGGWDTFETFQNNETKTTIDLKEEQ